jgi:hypothetical protein
MVTRDSVKARWISEDPVTLHSPLEVSTTTAAIAAAPAIVTPSTVTPSTIIPSIMPAFKGIC